MMAASQGVLAGKGEDPVVGNRTTFERLGIGFSRRLGRFAICLTVAARRIAAAGHRVDRQTCRVGLTFGR
jgi:hypothetical protein